MEVESVTEEVEVHNKDGELEVAPALIAVHPTQHSLVVAIGSDLRVFNLRGGCPVILGDGSGGHKDSIRAISYGANGKVFVSAGDDKLVKIWTTDSWRCIYNVSSEKRVTAVAISNDGQYVSFADKFGVVWVVELEGLNENSAVIDKKPAPMFSHYCSIITGLDFSPDGKYIVSADRDFKIRVTAFPTKPQDGAHEIQSFCLGHTKFVSCFTFVCSQDYPQGFLVSGSGDSTVRLWEYASGSLLHTCKVGAEAGLLHSNGSEEDILPVITDLCASRDGSLVAVAAQSFPGVLLLSCNLSIKSLSVVKKIAITEEAFIPTCLSTSTSELLWLVMGVSNLQGSDSPSLARVRAISCLGQNSAESVEHKPVILADSEIPGGQKLLETLQGNLSIEEEVFLKTAEAVKLAMDNLLIKKQYNVENREYRKRGRNDKKKYK
ncbi:tRNA (guanine-N(7)-)-methyltransferase non-catalytic subunit [Heracleum sosnowskyi]|uniref:tRNA (guanine-N(7)-)-methyltransferase non-catalytic subunit n=1 Tax=Heracleum sosnowskyi TaxID=360622 RepID=A0AAD8GR36_9APIA|nr:tRNA (guanine-N(7)-)-methyltransferase non-catalytic subunit [Heracleum sosnowskyi]